MRKLDTSLLAILALGGLCLATALALLAPLGWPFELFAHFRPQYAAAALLVASILAWRRHAVAAGLALTLAMVNAWPGALRALAERPPASCVGPAFTVATANLRYTNDDHPAFRAWLVAHPADFVLVQEVTAAWASALSDLDPYPHRYLLAREDPYGIGVLSRWPLQGVRPVDLAGDGLPSLEGVVTVDGRSLRFVGLHTHWPVLPELARQRDRVLAGAAAIARNAREPVLLLGDLNLAPDAPGYRRLIDASGLNDVMTGPGWRPTWRAGFWPLALRIDHILVSPAICVEQTGVSPSIGSDHRPVTARLRAPR